MKKILYSIFLFGVALSITSCLHDDDKIFGTPAAERIEQAVDSDKTLLESASNGWELHLWTGEQYSSGGYTYLMRFKNNKVTVGSDFAPSGHYSTSSYDVIKDQGPVLTINTYNEIFHELATPTMSDDDGEQQDYEFVIMRTTPDSIYLKGKKWGNKMVMTRLADSVNWDNRIAVLNSMVDNLKVNYNVFVTGKKMGSVNLDPSRVMKITTDSATQKMPFYITATGIHLLNPVSIDGKTCQNFNYDDEAMTLTCSDAGASEVVFNAIFMKYEDYAGSYKLNYDKGASLSVKLVPAGDGKTYNLVGLMNNVPMKLNYNKNDGTLSWLSQDIGTLSNGDHVWLAAWDIADGGYLYFDPKFGLTLSLDADAPGTTLLFKSFSPYSDFATDSFILWEVTSTGSSVGQFSGILFTNKSNRLRYLNSMVKTN
ncbi:MAG TPA: hypothetical protein DCS83_06540 [Prevotella sp.]|nr:hypothetical protein [Prevotella sp.]